MLSLGVKYQKITFQQECIPVGCIPAARRPCSGVSFPVGVCQVRGWGAGGLPGRGGRWEVGGGGSAWSRGGGVSARSGGVSAWSGGVSAWSGGCLPGLGRGVSVCSGGVGISQHALRQTPSPPPWTEFLTHACENITLAQLRCGR